MNDGTKDDFRCNLPKIIVGRHGRTVSNRDGRIMGGSDSPLILDGVQTAKELALILADEQISAIFSSHLGRAAFTASIYSEKLNIPIYFRPSLAELSAGRWEKEYRCSVRGDLLTLRDSWLDRPPGGESYQDAEFRIKSFLKEISAGKSEGSLLVVGHAGVNRVFLKLLLNIEPSLAITTSFPHDLVYAIESQGEIRYRTSTDSSGRGLLLEAH